MSGASILSGLLSKKALNLPTKTTSPKALTNQILTHLKANRLKQAVSILFASPVCFPYSLYADLFRLCSSNLAIIEARKVESQLIGACSTPPTFLLNRAIETFGICGCLSDARELFDEMPQRDGGSWNAMIKACVQCGKEGKALDLFKDMNKEGVFANEVTFAGVLGACSDVLELCLSRQIHGHIVKYGFCGNVILESSLVDVYGKCDAMSEARRMFDEIENPNDITWNVIVRRYLEVGDEKEAVIMFFKMFGTDIRPLTFTFSTTLTACSGMRAIEEGMQIHGVAVKINYEEKEVVLNSLIDMYVKCGEIESARTVFDLPGLRELISWTSIVSAYAMSGRMKEARELFNKMPERNVISWNSMLAGYTRTLQWEEAIDFVGLMCTSTKDIDHVTVGLMLNIGTGLSDVDMGKQVHGFIYRHGFSSNVVMGNSILDMYGKCGNLRSARVWFHQMSESRDVVSWNALLTSYARHQRSEQTMAIFREMQQETKPTKFTFGTLLAACANICALDQGKQIHGFMIRNGYDMDVVITGALVDMYSKCRRLEYALVVFREANSRDLVLWNSIILGCCHLENGKKALQLFRSMIKEGVKPDNVTFQAILLACMYEGHVELGRQYFNSMKNEYCIIPRLEHYECIIELFSRYGCMNELETFVKAMPFDPTTYMLTRVFDACKKYRWLRLGEWAAERLNAISVSSEIADRSKARSDHHLAEWKEP